MNRYLDARLAKLERANPASDLSHLSDVQLRARLVQNITALAGGMGLSIEAVIDDIREEYGGEHAAVVTEIMSAATPGSEALQ
jgi:hypothetical protein